MKKGFSLIEVLVATTIIAGLGVVLSQSFFTTTRTSVKVGRVTEVNQSGQYAVSIMERMIRNARTLSAVCTSGGTTETSSVAVVSPDGYETTFGCQYNNGVTRIASMSSFGTRYLTSGAVTLGGDSCEKDTLAFYCTSVSGVPRNVKVSFQLSQKGAPVDQFEKASTGFQTEATVRSNE